MLGVGRAQERAASAALISDVASGTGRVALISGEAGIGKSELTEWVAAAAAVRDFEVRATSYDELGNGQPLRALWRLLFDKPPVLENWLDGDGQYVLAEALLERIQEAAMLRPQLIVLDDLQWADASTLRALPTLVGDLADVPVLWVLAMRPNPPSADREAAVRSLERRGATKLDLGPLSIDELIQIARHELSATSEDDAVRRLLERAGGNPFLAKEVLHAARFDRLLRVEGGQALLSAEADDLVPDRLPGLEQLPETTLELLSVASVLGRRIEVDLLASLAELGPTAVWRLLEPAVRSRFLERTDAGVRFCHDLVHERLRQQLAPPRRTELHLLVAEIAAERGASVAQIEHHIREANQPLHPRLAGQLLDAGDRMRHSAPAEAAQLAELVRALAEDADQAAEATALLAEAYIFTGRITEADALALAELSTAVPEPNATRLRNTRASAWLIAGRVAEAAVEFEEVARSGDPTGADLGIAAVDAAVGFAVSSDMSAAAALVDDVLAGTPGPVAAAYAQCVRGLISGIRGDVVGGLEQATVGVAIADSRPDHGAHRNLLLYFLGQLQVWSHDLTGVQASITRGRALGTELGLCWHETYYHVIWAQSLLLQWRLDEAEATARAGLSYSRVYDSHMEDAHLHAVLAEIAIERADFSAAREHIAAIDTAQQRGNGYGADELFRLRAQLSRANGRLDETHATLTMLWGALVDLGIGVRLWQLAPNMVASAMDVGDTGAADDAIATVTGIGPPPAPHLAPWLHAVRSGTRELETVASRLEGNHHARQHLEAIRRRLSPAAASPTRSDVASGWRAQVTAAEGRVLDQLAGGATNRQIAETLNISRRTVESHLYRCYAKLGVQSRVELALLISKDHQP